MAEEHQSAILETPFGILAPGGHWYFISREQIEKYTPGLLDKYSLEFLLKISDRWIQSSAIMSLIAFAIMFFSGLDLYVTFSASVLVYLFWAALKSAFITTASSSLIRFISNNIFIYIFSLLFFSYLGMNNYYTYLMMAFILFIIVKFPILKIIRNRINLMLKGAKYVSEEDKVFNMVLIRFAMSEGILTENVRDLENQLFDLIHYNRSKKNG